MSRHALTAALVGLFAVHTGAAEPVGSPYAATPTYVPARLAEPYHEAAPRAWSGSWRPMAGKNSRGGCSATNCESCSKSAGGNRLQKFIDLLCYRPTVCCDCCPTPTGFVPPLHAWFPSCCHANAGCGAVGCAPGLCKKGHGQGCATCAAQVGKPVMLSSAMTPRVQSPETKHTTVSRPTTKSASMSPQKPDNRSSITPAGYRTQPSSYYLPPRR